LLGNGLACPGLVALTAYCTVQRSKEIDIRKVLGAGVLQILSLISGDFIRWVILDSLLAFPIAFFFLRRWLQHFAYRIDLGWGVFVAAALASAAIALLSVGLEAIRSARANPGRSLRTD
jgi:putative ABC transport system permease protein